MTIKGEIFWALCDTVTGGITRGHHHNVVTLDASILIARFIKGTATANVSEPAFGAFYLAVGTGNPMWQGTTPPAGTNTQRSLYNELGRKQFSSSNFITSLGTISAVPTNILDLTTTFATTEVVGALMEMGLIGGDCSSNASVTNPVLPPNGNYDPTVNLVGLDTLLNYLTFPAVNKPPTSTLSYTWRLTL